jgi:hypothetical protein
LKSKDGAFYARGFGTSEDKPVPSDFDADGRADIAVWRPSNGVWYTIRSSNDTFSAVQFGESGDMALRSNSIPE